MSSDEERWHVRLAPGEVKLLTLEQIDDLYRLDMIDADTLLRQDGTVQWLPLRVVAGLDEVEAEPAPPPVVRSAPPPLVVRSAPPPPPAPLPPPASERAPFSPSPSFVPPPISARAPGIVMPAPAAPSSAPPATGFAPAPSFAPPPASFAPPAVSAAAAISFAPPLQPPRASRAEPLLIALAALLGLLVVLHRNGALASLSASAGRAAAYSGFEAALGGPGFGTPRAVDALVAKTPALAAPSTNNLR